MAMPSLSSHGPRPVPIQSTAGAVPVYNEKGELSMEKVKVKRYISGKRPDYAPMESSDEEEGEDDFKLRRLPKEADRDSERDPPALLSSSSSTAANDARLKRLQARQLEDDVEERLARHRQIVEPEVLEEEEDDDDDDDDDDDRRIPLADREDTSEEEEEEIDDEEIERRRTLMRERAKEREDDETELLDVEDEAKSGGESGSESEYEEYTDSEEEAEPLLKPVFIRKKERLTVQEKELQTQKQKEQEAENKRVVEERRKYSLKIVEEEARREFEENRRTLAALDTIDTDNENDEEEYETWKVRELKRVKRDREEREAAEKDKLELDRMHTMTEEERRAELRANPKVITNRVSKGKYKFLQKYYHRGAFFMDEEENVYKRDFTEPTLEDHFDKTILPKVMQVKNFGRSGRTKYTHLVDQDTTAFDSAWAQDNAQNTKFYKQKAAGVRDIFDRPAVKKRKTAT
ncbi:unnamed protein product [Lampetra fluviatilis]